MTLKIESKEQFEAWMMEHAKPFNWDIRPEGPVFMPEDVRALFEALRPRWVPVAKSEPEKDGRYEVTYGISGLHCTVREVCHAFFRSKTNGLYRWTDAIGRPVLYVVAWKPVTPEYWDDVPPLPEES